MPEPVQRNGCILMAVVRTKAKKEAGVHVFHLESINASNATQASSLVAVFCLLCTWEPALHMDVRFHNQQEMVEAFQPADDDIGDEEGDESLHGSLEEQAGSLDDAPSDCLDGLQELEVGKERVMKLHPPT
eukprot:scaffold142377_cov19-Tisochrysis_lutea.AAC.6